MDRPEPDPLLTATLPVNTPGVLVVHGHGTKGALAVPADDLKAVIDALKDDYGLTTAVLLACQQQASQQFATTHHLTTWSTPHQVWVSPSTGKVFIGPATLTASGRLKPDFSAAAATLHRHDPGADAEVTPASQSPVTVLTPEQAAASTATDWGGRLRGPSDPRYLRVLSRAKRFFQSGATPASTRP